MKGMFFKGIVVGALTSTLVLAASVAVAATGGNFVLGSVNSADQPTRLTNTGVEASDSGLEVTANSASAPALRGRHVSTSGIGAGLIGESSSTSPGAMGLLGLILPSSPGANSTGVLGRNNGTGSAGSGVSGSHLGSGAGVLANSVGGPGVNAFSQTGNGVVGRSTGGNGVQGVSAANSASGVFGENSGNGPGVLGRSTNPFGFGVSGVHTAGGYAGYFNGKTYLGGNTTLTGALECTGCVGSSDIADEAKPPRTHTYYRHWGWSGSSEYLLPPKDATPTAIISLNLPAGTYIVSGSANFNNENAFADQVRVAQCVFDHTEGYPGTGAVSTTIFGGGDTANAWGSVSKTTLATLSSPGTVSFLCVARTGPTSASSVRGRSADMTAVTVDQLN